MSDPWDHILTSVGYKDQETFELTADQIKACKTTWNGPKNQFEPRLLCYQTSANSRPEVFKHHNLYILPIKNGTYLLCKTNIYMPLDYIIVHAPATPTLVKPDQTSVMLSIGSSETSLIDNMRYSGIFERPEILGEPLTHGPLLNGRHRITTEFTLGPKTISISGVQYETDSCYESKNKILIIEGKSSQKPIDSFNIRQLYFPYREALRLLQSSKQTKQIICLFIHELNSIIHVWVYEFSNPNSFDSITLKGHYLYQFH